MDMWYSLRVLKRKTPHKQVSYKKKMNFELQKAERMNFSEHFKPTEVCNKNTRVIQNKKNVKKLGRK